MKRTVRENIRVPYSLHDMRVAAFEVRENTLTIHLLHGLVKIGNPCRQVDGSLEFRGVDWDFCSACLLKYDGKSSSGRLSGEKMDLREFAKRYSNGSFEIVDETFGYNQTKFAGFVSDKKIVECLIEIYHEGDMVYVTEE